MNNDQQLKQFISAYIGRANHVPEEPFHKAIIAGDIKTIRTMLKGNPGLINHTNRVNGSTPLMTLMHAGDKELRGEIFGLILNHPQLDVSLSDYHGNTALHIAVSCSLYNMIPALLNKGADPNRVNKDRKTPLMLHTQSMQTFIDYYISSNRARSQDDTWVMAKLNAALSISMSYNKAQKNNIWVSFVTNIGNFDQVPIDKLVDLLIFLISIKDYNGIDICFNMGMNLARLDPFYHDLFLAILKYGALSVFKKFIIHGFPAHHIDKEGNTSLHLSARYEHPHMIEYLLEIKCSPDLPNNEGHYPLDVALNLEVIPLLMNASKPETLQIILKKIITDNNWTRLEWLLFRPTYISTAFAQLVYDSLCHFDPFNEKEGLLAKAIKAGAQVPTKKKSNKVARPPNRICLSKEEVLLLAELEDKPKKPKDKDRQCNNKNSKNKKKDSKSNSKDSKSNNKNSNLNVVLEQKNSKIIAPVIPIPGKKFCLFGSLEKESLYKSVQSMITHNQEDPFLNFCRNVQDPEFKTIIKEGYRAFAFNKTDKDLKIKPFYEAMHQHYRNYKSQMLFNEISKTALEELSEAFFRDMKETLKCR